MATDNKELYLSGPPLVIATLAVALASFMNILDTTIAIVALPTISGNLGATASQGSWIITIYSVCLAVVLPLSGWITRRFGEVRVFCVAIFMFSLASWLCAIATNFNELLLFRALQGFTGGLLLPLSQSLLLRMYPPEKHGLALGIWAITSAVAPVMGPILGGYITDNFGWPWIFLINVPVGIFSVYFCWKILRSIESEIHREPVDFIGLVLLMVGVICFQLVLDRGHELDWLASNQIRVMLVVSVLFFFLFLAWEWGEPHPVVDLSLFAHRNFVLGSLLISVIYICFILATVLTPIWLQTIQGYTATWAGLVMAPFGILPLLLMPVIGQRLRLWDARPTITFGIVIFVIAFYLHAQTSVDSTAGYIAFCRFLMGSAMPFAWMPLMLLALVGLPAEKMTSATGLFNFLRMLASSLGTAAGVTLWDDRTIHHRNHLVENLSADSPQYRQAMELLVQRLQDPQAAMAALDAAVGAQARTLALDDIFYLSAAVILPPGIFCVVASGTRREQGNIGMIDIANSEARYLALLHRQMMKQLERELAPLNLGPGRYLYLFGLYIRDGRRQQDLADTIGVDKAAATRALSRLEACGYVSRRADKGDGRAMLVYLTPKGRELRSELEAAASHCIENLTRELAEQERQELRRLLAKMALPLTAQ